MDKSVRKAIIDKLTELGQDAFQQSDIVSEGTRLVIPEKMSLSAAIDTLESFQTAQAQSTMFTREFAYRPYDGAVATANALVTLTGTSGIGQATQSFFGSTPPRMITIPTGVDSSVQVPWGEIYVDLWDGVISLHALDTEDGPIFGMSVEAARAFGPSIEGFFRLVENELATNSIYRGQALYGDMSFYDPYAVDRTEVVYTAEVQRQIETNIWSPIRHTDAIRDAGLPIKRAVLLQGGYGTGKTLCGALTAQEAVENGWTFIYARPSDDLTAALATARLYAPAVVFSEDIDREGTPDASDDDGSALLDTFDGLGAKGRDVVVVLTSNHPERLHRGLVRPGRLDAIIEIAAMDEVGIRTLIERIIGNEALDHIDPTVVAKAVDGYSPAYVREVLDRAKRYAIARDGVLGDITTEDLVASASGLRAQLELMEAAPEKANSDGLREAFVELLDLQLNNYKLNTGDLRFVKLDK